MRQTRMIVIEIQMSDRALNMISVNITVSHYTNPGSGGSALPRGLARKPRETILDESWRCCRRCALEDVQGG